jgi:hypothetical protein
MGGFERYTLIEFALFIFYWVLKLKQISATFFESSGGACLSSG